MLQPIFRGRRSAWFPLLTVRRFSEFDTSVSLPCRALATLVPEVFLDFSLLEMRV